MASPGKQREPHPKAAASAPPAERDGTPQETKGAYGTDAEQPIMSTAIAESDSSPKPPPSGPPISWHSGGSWQSKASPIAQTSRESILVAQGATSEASEAAARLQSQSVSKSMRGSRKSIPLVAEATRVHATSDAGDQCRPSFPSAKKVPGLKVNGIPETKPLLEEPPLPAEPLVEADEDAKSTETSATILPAVAWLGWWSRPDGYGSESDKLRDSNKRRKVDVEDSSTTPLPSRPAAQPVEPAINDEDIKRSDEGATTAGVVPPVHGTARQPETSPAKVSSTSWFGLWSSAQNFQAQQESPRAQKPSEEPPKKLTNDPPKIIVPAEPVSVQATGKPDGTNKDDNKLEGQEQPKSTGWAFWSTDRPSDAASKSSGPHQQVGELAVADTPSQSHPEVAQYNEQPQQAKSAVKSTDSSLKPKRERDDKLRLSPKSLSTVGTPADSQAPPSTLSVAPTPVDTPPSSESETPAPVQRSKQKQLRPNLILPLLRESFFPAPQSTYLERLAHYLALTLRLPGSQPEPPSTHVFISSSPPKVRKAIAIGVHGWFPSPMIRQVLGQPTGSSIRFAKYSAAAIKAWCNEHQPDIKNVEIEQVALEGEGYIADRVDTLWKLLLNWISHLRQADFILIAAHSQGVPVAFALLAKLIQLGCLGPHVRLGICAMAGINLGPFLEYKSRIFGATAFELFDFCSSTSKVSRAYADSLDVCLRHGVRVSFVGSIDDQLVSLESSLHAPLTHPYVNRAVFIDGRVHAPNFLTHLVVFALRLRNRGLHDHGLLRELSAPLAGSIVGDGHSRVYDDSAVYKLGVEFALESTDVPKHHSSSSAPTAASRSLATNAARAHELAAKRRASLSGYPPSVKRANSIRRGSLSAAMQLPGIPPIIVPYEPPVAGSEKNPFYLPWAVRSMLGEEAVQRDPALKAEVRQLVKEFEEWKPTSKVLRDVRWRLEGVRSML